MPGPGSEYWGPKRTAPTVHGKWKFRGIAGESDLGLASVSSNVNKNEQSLGSATVDSTVEAPLRICTEISGVHSICLFDTGSSYSVLSEEYATELRANPNFSGPQQLSRYRGKVPMSASHHALHVQGELKLTVSIAGLSRVVHFLVVENLSEPCILGRNGIDSFGTWKYSPKSKRFFLRGKIVPLCDMYGEEEGLVARIADTVTIPPRTVQHVPLEIADKRKSSSRLLFIEPSSNFLAHTGLLPFPTVVKKNGLIGTKVSNLSDSDVTVTSGHPFGVAEAVSFVTSKQKAKSTRRNQPADVNVITMEDQFKFLEENLKLDNSTFSEEQQSELLALLFEHADVFSTGDADLGHTDMFEHVIDTGNAKPIFQRPYRAEFQKRTIIEREVNKMFSTGLIEPSNSAWSSPVVLVTKKDNSIRFCANYIKSRGA